MFQLLSPFDEWNWCSFTLVLDFFFFFFLRKPVANNHYRYTFMMYCTKLYFQCMSKQLQLYFCTTKIIFSYLNKVKNILLKIEILIHFIFCLLSSFFFFFFSLLYQKTKYLYYVQLISLYFIRNYIQKIFIIFSIVNQTLKNNSNIYKNKFSDSDTTEFLINFQKLFMKLY